MEVDNVPGQVHKRLWSLYSEDRKNNSLEVIPKKTRNLHVTSKWNLS